MIVVYQSSESRNNFYLLHAVTSTWALSQLLPVLDAAKEENAAGKGDSDGAVGGGDGGGCGGSDGAASGSASDSSSSVGGGPATVNVNSQGFKMELVRVHLCTLLALYVTQKCPRLNEKLLVRKFLTKSLVG